MRGIGVPPNPAAAAKWLREAMDEGEVGAGVLLGELYLLGRGVPADRDEGMRCIKRSADAGDPNGLLLFGQCEISTSHEREGVALVKRSADTGRCPHAATAYAKILRDGKIAPRDERAALRYLKLAADAGEPAGEYEYGLCLYRGDGVKTDLAGAARYLKRSADRGSVDGLFAYGCMLLQGDGVPADPVAAAKCFKAAADQGHTCARQNYGMCLFRGIGVQIDLNEAKRYLEGAADVANAQFQAGLQMLNGMYNFGSAIAYLEDAAKSGHAGAKEMVEGLADSIFRPTQRAMVTKAHADRGGLKAQMAMAEALRAGVGCAKDDVAATHYLGLAANQGSSNAQFDYARCLQTGLGCAIDHAEAAKYFKMAAEQGHGAAANAYGLCLDFGRGVEVDEAAALSFYKRAVELGDADAVINVRCSERDAAARDLSASERK